MRIANRHIYTQSLKHSVTILWSMRNIAHHTDSRLYKLYIYFTVPIFVFLVKEI